MIKNRDFWMPFALSILYEKHHQFIKNDKKIFSEFMTIGFDTIKENNYLIQGGIHPYDQTVRPQMLQKNKNLNYYNLINEFYKISGVPAVLNTSLNLHGSPISSDIDDVVKTFKRSGLKYLFLENKYLIIKKN
jgi:carbamoyltransferase